MSLTPEMEASTETAAGSRRGAAVRGEAGATPSGFLAGGGAMGALIRAHDWAATPLGPPGDWPRPLRTAAAILLGANVPMAVYWGACLVLIYNDAWRALIGGKHPSALGRPAREVFPEVWGAVGPMFADAMAGRGGGEARDQLLPLDRNGRVEDAWFDYSFNPIPLEDGTVGGILNIATETTARVRTERALRAGEVRQAFLLALGDALRDVADPREVMQAAAGLLGRHLSADRAGWAEVDAAGVALTVERDWCAPGMPSLAGRRRLDDFGPALIAEFRAGRTVAFDDAPTGPPTPGADVAGAQHDASARAAVAVPLVEDGRFAAALYVHGREPRRWTGEEVALVREVAERTWAAVERARAEAALRRSEARWRGLFETMQEGVAICEMVYDAEGRAVDYRHLALNAAWGRLTGVPNERVQGKLLSEAIPGIEPYWLETYARVVETGEPAHFEHFLDVYGRWFEVMAYRTEPGRFAAVFLDVTERKAAEARQELLAREVDHRAKNALAVVQTMLRLTRAGDVASFARAVEGRVAALARAQTLLAEGRWDGADLHAVLRGELAPFLAGQRTDLDGPPLVLPPGAAQPLSMALHELATNAAKHGALSRPGGRVSVSWRLDGGAAAGVLKLRWAEAGGPPVAGPPARRGFGSRVLDGTVRGQLGGAVSLAWARTGLVCEMEVPLGRGPASARAADAGAAAAD